MISNEISDGRCVVITCAATPVVTGFSGY